ncbi:MAG: CoA transferase [Firmicutes bacterium]|nr:CoA transferase [Bacillota bacterium]
MRVLDFSRALAGPLCARLLGEGGMEVWKIEDPTHPDLARTWGPFSDSGESLYYWGLNFNKTLVTTQLDTLKGREQIRKWVREADVVIDNFRSSTREHLGLSYERLTEANPRLIMASFQAYHTASERPGLDITLQAHMGFTRRTADDVPQRVAVPAIDIVTGMQGAIGILQALTRRNDTGSGDHLVFSLETSSLLLLNHLATASLNACLINAPDPMMNPVIVPNGLFETGDGWMALCTPSNESFRRLCHVLRLDDMALKYLDSTARLNHAQDVTTSIKERLKTQSAQSWVTELKRVGVVAELVRSLEDIVWENYADLIVTDPVGHRVLKTSLSNRVIDAEVKR